MQAANGANHSKWGQRTPHRYNSEKWQRREGWKCAPIGDSRLMHVEVLGWLSVPLWYSCSVRENKEPSMAPWHIVNRKRVFALEGQ